jgi:O-antigen/teichoic acid export membrane protein
MEGPGVFGIIVITFFAMLFGLGYLRNRESMAMIERGMDPRRYRPHAAPYQTLKWGLLMIGAGLGLFIAFMLDRLVFGNRGPYNFALYYSLIAIFGGLGLFISYLIEKKEYTTQKQAAIEETHK